MPETTMYLRVIGRLYPDRQLELRPGYLTGAAPWSDRDGESPLRAETFDDGGASLGSFPLRLSPVYHDGGGRERPQAVRGFVPFHPRTRRVVFDYEGRPILDVVRSDSAPRVEFTWRPDDGLTGAQTVTWDGEHPEGLPVQYFLRFSRDGGDTWDRIGTRTAERSAEVDVDDLPGGEQCLLAVVATDGINTAVAESAPFALPRRPCVALIRHPQDGGTYLPEWPIPLQGQGFWRERAEPEWEELEWRTAAGDESLGRGRRVDVTLPPGEHTISLLAGGGDDQGRADVTITVVDPADPG
jgi:hypothetical protein